MKNRKTLSRKTSLGACWRGCLFAGRPFYPAALLIALSTLQPPTGSFAQTLRQIEDVAALPDAPTPAMDSYAAPEQDAIQNTTVKPPSQPEIFKIGPWRDPKSLDLSMPVGPLTVGDKLRLSIREQFTPFALASMVFAAGWEQLVNSNPKYGTNSTAFAERVGAAAARQSSQAIFSDGICASVFRQDPRYYRLANGSMVKRIFYAAGRTFRTRSDSGNPQINYSLLFGHATAQALTLAYYPDRSQNGHVAVTGFAWSLLGSMLGNQYHEFWPDVLQTILQAPPAGPKPTPVPGKPRETSLEQPDNLAPAASR